MSEEDSFSSSSSSHRGAGSSSLITIKLKSTGPKKKHPKGGSLEVEKREDGYYYGEMLCNNLFLVLISPRFVRIATITTTTTTTTGTEFC